MQRPGGPSQNRGVVADTLVDIATRRGTATIIQEPAVRCTYLLEKIDCQLQFADALRGGVRVTTKGRAQSIVTCSKTRPRGKDCVVNFSPAVLKNV